MADNSIIPVILCGGSGTRLWPLSRQQHPKQFLKLLGEHSLFQQTLLRARKQVLDQSPLIVGNDSHRFLVLDELTELGIEGATLLLEPVGRNTAPALAVAAIYACERQPDALLLALPADHYLKDDAAFAAAVDKGAVAARQGAVVVFGVAPSQPHTGYGYIRKGEAVNSAGVYRVAQFKEKPSADEAGAYVVSGEYLWNSGIFLVRADVYLRELEQHAPDIAHAAEGAMRAASREGFFLRLDAEAFGACRSESIDYAVMEHTDVAAVVELGVVWNDLGSWSSLMETGNQSTSGNVMRGDVLLSDVEGSFVYSSGRLVSAVGLRDHVVVETADAVFVAPLARAQDVKQLVATLREQRRGEADNHLRVYRPWGWYESITRGERMQVKRIQVKPGASLSLQLHHHRSEHWVVVSGEAEVTRGAEVFVLTEDQSTYIPMNTKHRLSNKSARPLEVIEVQTGSYVGEDDIVRFEDRYGRC